MWSLLQARDMANVVWLYSRSILPQLMQLQIVIGATGQLLWMPPAGLAGAPYGTLLGRPLLPVENCQKLGDKGDILLADLSQYIMIDKGGPQFASSIHVQFLFDETTFRIVYRCDGQPAVVSTLTPRDGSSAVSPFVTLAAR
jgi:HK97 family phage major capsid protein